MTTLDCTSDYMPWRIEPILAPNQNTVMLAVLWGWACLLAALFWALPYVPEMISVFLLMTVLSIYSGWRMAKDINATPVFWLGSLLGTVVFMLAVQLKWFEAVTGKEWFPLFMATVFGNAIGQAVIMYLAHRFLKWGYKGKGG